MSQTVTTKLRGFVAAFTALVLTLALVPATAFAALTAATNGSTALTGSITVTGITTRATVNAYKIADILVDDKNVAQWSAVDETDQANPTYNTALANAIEDWIEADGSATEAQDIVDVVDSLVENQNISTAASQTASGSSTSPASVTLTGLAPGIYYIEIVNTSSDSAVEYQNVIVSLELTYDANNTNGNYWGVESGVSIACKSADSTLNKTVLYEDLKTDNVYKTGDTIWFMVEFEITTYLESFTLVDVMTGLEYNSTNGVYLYTNATYSNVTDVTVAQDGLTITGDGSGTPVTDFTLSNYVSAVSVDNSDLDTPLTLPTNITDTTVGSTLTLNLTESAIDSLFEAIYGDAEGNYDETSVTLYLIYSADILEAASVTGIYNNVYSNLTNPDGDTPEPGDKPGDDDETVGLSAGIEIYKYDAYVTVNGTRVEYVATNKTISEIQSETTGLAGAIFSVYAIDPETDFTEREDELSDYFVGTIETKAGGLGTSGLNLKIGVTYYLVEDEVPSGYLQTDSDNTFVVTLGGDDDTATGHAAVTAGNYATWAISNTSYADYTGNQDPSWGFNLPTTGGMGTILFTIVGVLVMAGAAYLIIRSRKQQQD